MDNYIDRMTSAVEEILESEEYDLSAVYGFGYEEIAFKYNIDKIDLCKYLLNYKKFY